MSKIRYVLFDAANTLIHKPELWGRIRTVLRKNGTEVPEELLKRNHKLLSESIRFPDRTSRDFYHGFNSELLYSLGILPTPALLEEIFSACTYLPWVAFNDAAQISKFPVPLGILSNFNSSLNELALGNFGDIFRHIIISEVHGVGKPSPEFYKIAVKEIGLQPDEILYVGDSIKLDMEPAERTGLRHVLIDRDNVYPLYRNRIISLEQLTVYLQN